MAIKTTAFHFLPDCKGTDFRLFRGIVYSMINEKLKSNSTETAKIWRLLIQQYSDLHRNVFDFDQWSLSFFQEGSNNTRSASNFQC